MTIDGRHVRVDGPGEGFGEIALEGDVSRALSTVRPGVISIRALDAPYHRGRVPRPREDLGTGRRRR